MAACSLGDTEETLRHRSCSYQVFLGRMPNSMEMNSQVLGGCTGCGRRRAREVRRGRGSAAVREARAARFVGPRCARPVGFIRSYPSTLKQHFHSSSYVLPLRLLLGQHARGCIARSRLQRYTLHWICTRCHGSVRVSNSVEDQVVASDSFCTAGPGRCADVYSTEINSKTLSPMSL